MNFDELVNKYRVQGELNESTGHYYIGLNRCGQGECTDGQLLSFEIDQDDVDRFPELDPYDTLHIFVDGQGDILHIFYD